MKTNAKKTHGSVQGTAGHKMPQNRAAKLVSSFYALYMALGKSGGLKI